MGRDSNMTPLFRLQIVDQSGKVLGTPDWRLERDILALLPWWARFLVKRAFLKAIQRLKDDTRHLAQHYR